MPFRLTPPNTVIFLASVTLAIIAAVARVLISLDIPAPYFPLAGSYFWLSPMSCFLPVTSLKGCRIRGPYQSFTLPVAYFASIF